MSKSSKDKTKILLMNLIDLNLKTHKLIISMTRLKSFIIWCFPLKITIGRNL